MLCIADHNVGIKELLFLVPDERDSGLDEHSTRLRGKDLVELCPKRRLQTAFGVDALIAVVNLDRRIPGTDELLS